jgi:hypothetical protein
MGPGLGVPGSTAVLPADVLEHDLDRLGAGVPTCELLEYRSAPRRAPRSGASQRRTPRRPAARSAPPARRRPPRTGSGRRSRSGSRTRGRRRASGRRRCRAAKGASARPAASAGTCACAAGLGGDHAVAGQHPVHRRPGRGRDGTALRELVADPPGVPPRVRPADLADQRLDVSSEAGRAGMRAAGLVLQAVQPALLVPADPGIHRLLRDAVARRDLGDVRAAFHESWPIRRYVWRLVCVAGVGGQRRPGPC